MAGRRETADFYCLAAVCTCVRGSRIDRATGEKERKKERGEADWVSPCLASIYSGIATCPVINPRKFFVSSSYAVICPTRDRYGARGKNYRAFKSSCSQIKTHFSTRILGVSLIDDISINVNNESEFSFD